MLFSLKNSKLNRKRIAKRNSNLWKKMWKSFFFTKE